MNIKKGKFTALIPARSGSKGLKNKNIKILHGHPLIAYSITAAKMTSKISDVVVTTDSERIASIARKYGASTPFLRPKKISKDKSLDIEFFEHFIEFCIKKKLDVPEYIVHLSPTVPLREIKVMVKAINKIKNTPRATALRSVEQTSLVPEKIFRERKGFLEGYFPDLHGEYYNLPRQNYSEALIPNGQIDIIKAKNIIEGSLHGNKIISFITDHVPDIDNLKDYQKAEITFFEKRFSKIVNFLL